MKFPYNGYLAAILAGFAASAISLPFWRGVCVRVDLVDDPGHRKLHATTTPLAGGLAVATGIFMPILAGLMAVQLGWLDASTVAQLRYGFAVRALKLTSIMVGALGMLGVGILDDRWELRPAVKFAGQILIALGVAASGVRITLFVHSVLFSYVITILWILTVTNAFNFMDNMNGLCGGLGAIAGLFFGLFAVLAGQHLVAFLALLTCGALAGFLPYNYPRASSFLGDGGSHLVGYLMSIMAVIPHFYTARHPSPISVLTPLLVLGVPLFDLVWVVWLRFRIGQPFYVGDNNHLSHRLVRRGFSRARAVAVIWLLAAAVGITGLCLDLL